MDNIILVAERPPPPNLSSDALDVIFNYLSTPDTLNAVLSTSPAFASELTNSTIEKCALFLALNFLPLGDLSAFARVSKSCRECITTGAIVRAAVSRTGDRFNTRKSMDQLYEHMSRGAIFVPSPLRLLRIATGNKCEFCFCDQKTVGPWSYGSFACWDCIKTARGSLSRCWNTSSVRYGKNKEKYDAVFAHPRVAVSQLYGKKRYCWKEARESFGERIGPLVAWDDIDKMVMRMDNATNNGEFVQRIDDYIAEELHAPSTEEYVEFNTAYLAAKADLEQRAQRKEAQKAERKRKRKAKQQAKEERNRKKETMDHACESPVVGAAKKQD